MLCVLTILGSKSATSRTSGSIWSAHQSRTPATAFPARPRSRSVEAPCPTCHALPWTDRIEESRDDDRKSMITMPGQSEEFVTGLGTCVGPPRLGRWTEYEIGTLLEGDVLRLSVDTRGRGEQRRCLGTEANLQNGQCLVDIGLDDMHGLFDDQPNSNGSREMIGSSSNESGSSPESPDDTVSWMNRILEGSHPARLSRLPVERSSMTVTRSPSWSMLSTRYPIETSTASNQNVSRGIRTGHGCVFRAFGQDLPDEQSDYSSISVYLAMRTVVLLEVSASCPTRRLRMTPSISAWVSPNWPTNRAGIKPRCSWPA